LSKVTLGDNYHRAERNKLHCVQGHYVKYLNGNNSAADCSIAFIFGKVSSRHRRYSANVQMSVKSQGHWVKGQCHSVK